MNEETTVGGGESMRSENLFENRATIKVFGVGGGGSNAVNRMIREHVAGVHFVALNTDAQALAHSLAPKKIQLGPELTKGLGAGGDPQIGTRAAEECSRQIEAELKDADMVFITAGLGGGTGTGAAPIIAKMAKERGILTVGVVTKPFKFEGIRRARLAEESAESLKANVDTLITVPNDRLMEIIERKTTLSEAFACADGVLLQGVQSISDVIMLPGLINVDFADVQSVMKDAGVALMGLGHGVGEHRARLAAQAAANSPLLETNIMGARRLLVNITAGADFTIGEAYEAMEYILQFTDAEHADISMGHVSRELPGNEVRITLLAAGMDASVTTVANAVDPAVFVTPAERVNYDRAVTPSAAHPVPGLPPTPALPITTESIRAEAEARGNVVVQTEPIEEVALDEIDLDIPSFLRRQRMG